MAKRKAAKRERIERGKDKRFVRRGAKGRFKESDDVGRSLKRDRQQKAKRKVKSVKETGATGTRVIVPFTNHALRVRTTPVCHRSTDS